MAISTIRASLVGMRHHGVSQEEAIRGLIQQPHIMRQPRNPYDENAVAVSCGGKIVGHIDRESAAIIAPLLDDGAAWDISIDRSRSGTTGAIPLIIQIDRPIEKFRAPKVCGVGIAGIYRIFIGRIDRSYVGQSTDVRNRIRQHWEALARGVHQNAELRTLWRSKGGDAFNAALLERAPENLSGLSLARWLVEHETSWIEKFGGPARSINVETPKIVLGSSAKNELDDERKRCASTLQSLEYNLIELSNKLINDKSLERDYEMALRESRKFFGFFSSPESKNFAALAEKSLPSLRDNVSRIEIEIKIIEQKILALRKWLMLL